MVLTERGVGRAVLADEAVCEGAVSTLLWLLSVSYAHAVMHVAHRPLDLHPHPRRHEVAPRSRAEMVELRVVWTQAARVGATAGRAPAAEAEEAAEEAAEAAAEEDELLLGCI